MEKEKYLEGLRILILSNYIEMLKRKDKPAIHDFMNNPKSIESFLYALGASEAMMSKPAHRETLEACLKKIISSTLSAIKDGETGYEVEYLQHGLKTHTESLKYEEKYNLEFTADMYTFEVSRNIGEVSRKVKGSIGKSVIADYSKNRSAVYLDEDTEKLSKKQLDENGFVIVQTIQSGKQNKTIKREGIRNFINNGKQEIAWNGKPSELNEEKISPKEFMTNMCKIIEKYPQTKEYYGDIVGKDIVEQMMGLLKTRENNS